VISVQPKWPADSLDRAEHRRRSVRGKPKKLKGSPRVPGRRGSVVMAMGNRSYKIEVKRMIVITTIIAEPGLQRNRRKSFLPSTGGLASSTSFLGARWRPFELGGRRSLRKAKEPARRALERFNGQAEILCTCGLFNRRGVRRRLLGLRRGAETTNVFFKVRVCRHHNQSTNAGQPSRR